MGCAVPFLGGCATVHGRGGAAALLPGPCARRRPRSSKATPGGRGCQSPRPHESRLCRLSRDPPAVCPVAPLLAGRVRRLPIAGWGCRECRATCRVELMAAPLRVSGRGSRGGGRSGDPAGRGRRTRDTGWGAGTGCGRGPGVGCGAGVGAG